MIDKKFNNIIGDLVVDDAKRLAEMNRLTPANQTYLIVFTARSGSSWLTSQLSATKQLGYPEEYLNPNFVRNVCSAVNARTQADLLEMLLRRRKTSNGIFGIEVRHIDIELFGEDIFFKYFGPKTIIFNLWRDNIVAQGLSLYRAVTTGRFHSTEPGQPPPPPPYDVDGIKRWTTHILSTENANLRMLERHKRSARFLRYEDIMRSADLTITQFCDALKVDIQPIVEQTSPRVTDQKIGDLWNAEAEKQFRHENADFVSKIEQSRLIRRQPGEAGWIAFDAAVGETPK